jgi:hypothetical protein
VIDAERQLCDGQPTVARSAAESRLIRGGRAFADVAEYYHQDSDGAETSFLITKV